MVKSFFKTQLPQKVFSIFIMLTGAVFFWGAMQVEARARIFPVLLSTILFTMAFVQLLGSLWPDKKIFKILFQQGGFSTLSVSTANTQHISNNKENYHHLAVLILNLILFMVLFYLLTAYIAIPVFVIVLLGIVKKEKWFLVAMVAGGADLFIWLIFGLFLKTSL